MKLMSDKNNSNKSSDKSAYKQVITRTKWETENKSEKKAYLTRKQEEREAQRALRDFKYHSQVEDYNERYDK